jgi:hypothetical protein
MTALRSLCAIAVLGNGGDVNQNLLSKEKEMQPRIYYPKAALAP